MFSFIQVVKIPPRERCVNAWGLLIKGGGALCALPLLFVECIFRIHCAFFLAMPGQYFPENIKKH
ncbi:hypothetical protein ACK1XF_004758 [Salmonella enterica]